MPRTTPLTVAGDTPKRPPESGLSPRRGSLTDRRGYAETLAATAGDGDEVLTADDLLQRPRSGGQAGRRVCVAGATTGEPIEGVVRLATSATATRATPPTRTAPSPASR